MDAEIKTPEATEETMKATDYLMWIGSNNYPTVDDYIKEAKAMGCCKRIGKLPATLVPGESRVFLAHDDGIVGEGFVFGYFVVQEAQMLVNFVEDVPAHLEGKVTPVFLSDLEEEQERLCGDREVPGAIYLVGRKMYLVTENEAGELHEFKTFRKLEAFDPGRKHFRGALRIEYGDKMILARGKRFMMEAPSRQAPKNENPEVWTEEDDNELITRYTVDCVVEPKARIAQRFAFKTGRSRTIVLARITKLAKEGKIELIDNGSEEE